MSDVPNTLSLPRPLALWLYKLSRITNWPATALFVILGTIALITSANLKVHILEIAHTSQGFVIMFGAMCLFPRYAIPAAAAYAAITVAAPGGLFGIPFSANPAVAELSRGFLFGFVAAAAFVSFVWPLTSRHQLWSRILVTFAVGLGGMFIIYAIGFSWYYAIKLSQVPGFTLAQAWANMVGPYWVLDIGKVALAALLAYPARLARERNPY